MVRKELEYEKRVTKSETLTICDDCGREVDDGGGEWEKTGYHGTAPNIHLCSECEARFRNDDGDSDYVELVKDWKSNRCKNNDTVFQNIRYMLGYMFVGMVFTLIASFVQSPGMKFMLLFLGVAMGAVSAIGYYIISRPHVIPDRLQ